MTSSVPGPWSGVSISLKVKGMGVSSSSLYLEDPPWRPPGSPALLYSLQPQTDFSPGTDFTAPHALAANSSL